MQVVFPERVSMTIYRYAYFERGLTHTVLKMLKPGMVFFDIGAHFGYYSLLASKLVGDTGSVHSFEPTPSTFEVLKQNTASKRNVKTNNLAMWSEPTIVKFRDYGVTFSAFNSINEDTVQDFMRDDILGAERDVRATTIDEYVASSNATPDFIKLDAEGAEMNIIEGMQNTLHRSRPMMTIEVGDDAKVEQSRSRAVLEAIIANDYEAFEIHNAEIKPHVLLPRYHYANILLVPTQHAHICH
jgi:FkbM family methyltransferase